MSKLWREKNNIEETSKTSPEMRKYCQRPGRYLKSGKPAYFTEQNHTKECDVNYILKKYDQTGVITHVQKMEAKYGDMSGQDYKQMLDTVIDMQRQFDQMPSHIRKEFSNDPAKYLEFMENPDNRGKAIELGIIDPDWTIDTDGLGEHVKEGENKKSGEAESE